MSLALCDVGGFTVGFDTVPNSQPNPPPPPHTHTHTQSVLHILVDYAVLFDYFFVSSLGIIRLPRNDSLHVHVH